ncbi:MAG: sel1 repeat family protein [Polyangiaceae bacterium]|nr:sel1 repeat family protein [Polyangiaceae bacterium]
MSARPRAALLAFMLVGCWSRREPEHVAAPCPSEALPVATTSTQTPADSVAGLTEAELRAQRIAKQCVANEPGACQALAKQLARSDDPIAAPAPVAKQVDEREQQKKEAEEEAALGRKLLADPGPERLGAPEHLKKACDLGNAGACSDLGWAYSTGFGTLGEDRSRAGELYQKACDMKHALGCANRARLARGINDGLAAELFAKACTMKLDAACDELAGTVREAEAACKKSDKSCSNWGYLLDQGLGIKADRKKALAAYDRACNAGNRVGCYNAATTYRDGTAGKPDPAKAKARFEAGCRLKDDASCREVSPAIPQAKR